jgi:hypothetical protein
VQEIYWLAEFPDAVLEIDPNDLFSLQARLQDMDDPELTPLYNTVTALTSSLAHYPKHVEPRRTTRVVFKTLDVV